MAQNLNLLKRWHSPITALLIYAVKHNKTRLAKICIRLGANVNVQLADGNYLLHVCADEVMGSILISGKANVNARNASLETPLLTSMRRGIIALSLLLINSGTDLNTQDITGTCALHLAQAPIVNDTLLHYGANLNLQNNAGNTPLLVALQMKGSLIITPLINAGADKNIRNLAGNNAYDQLNILIATTNAELGKIEQAIYSPSQQSTTQMQALVTRYNNLKASLDVTEVPKANASEQASRQSKGSMHKGTPALVRRAAGYTMQSAKIRYTV